MNTEHREVEEIFKGYNYASFTWSGDNKTGVSCAKKSLRILKARVTKAIAKAKEEERSKILKILDGMEDHTARNVVLFHLTKEGFKNLSPKEDHLPDISKEEFDHYDNLPE